MSLHRLQLCCVKAPEQQAAIQHTGRASIGKFTRHSSKLHTATRATHLVTYCLLQNVANARLLTLLSFFLLSLSLFANRPSAKREGFFFLVRSTSEPHFFGFSVMLLLAALPLPSRCQVKPSRMRHFLRVSAGMSPVYTKYKKNKYWKIQRGVRVRWPDVPDFLKLPPKMSPILTLNGGKCVQTQSNTSYYGSHLTHRQRLRHMTYRRSSVNNNNLEAAKRKEKETSGRYKWYVV